MIRIAAFLALAGCTVQPVCTTRCYSADTVEAEVFDGIDAALSVVPGNKRPRKNTRED